MSIPHYQNPLHGGKTAAPPPPPSSVATPIPTRRSIKYATSFYFFLKSNPIRHSNQRKQLTSFFPLSLPPFPSAFPSPFLSWKTHELQEYLITNQADKTIVMHMHMKRDLAVAALQLCNQYHQGQIPIKPNLHSTHHTHTDTQYVKRSAKSYHQTRLAQHNFHQRMNRYNAGSYSQKHGMSRSLGHGPVGGTHSSGRLGSAPRAAPRAAPRGRPPPPQANYSTGEDHRRQQSHEIFQRTGKHPEEETKTPTHNRRSTMTTDFTRPSKLQAMAFAIEHSPRDWMRFEQEGDDVIEVERLNKVLKSMPKNSTHSKKLKGKMFCFLVRFDLF